MVNPHSDKPEYLGLIVDCVNVCLTDGAEDAVPTLASILQVKDAEIREAMRGEHRENFYKGQKNRVDYWTGVVNKLDLPLVVARQRVAERTERREDEIGLEQLAETLESKILESYKEIPEVTGVLEQLYEKGYRLGMISNSPLSRGAYWTEKFGFLHVFEGRVRLSGQYNEKKPEVLQKLLNLVTAEMGGGIQTSQIAYVDDKLKNVEASVAEVGGAIWLPPQHRPDETTAIWTPKDPKIIRATRETFAQTLKDAYGFKF